MSKVGYTDDTIVISAVDLEKLLGQRPGYWNLNTLLPACQPYRDWIRGLVKRVLTVTTVNDW